MLAHTLIYDFHYLFHAIDNEHTLIHISNSLLVRVLGESGIEGSIQLFCKHFHKLLLLRKKYINTPLGPSCFPYP